MLAFVEHRRNDPRGAEQESRVDFARDDRLGRHAATISRQTIASPG